MNVQEYELKKQAIEAYREEKNAQLRKLHQTIANLRSDNQKHPILLDFLQQLLRTSQEKDTAYISKLLTALKQETFDGDLTEEEKAQQANQVVCKTDFKGKMTLKILSQTPEGFEETITSGGEKNLLATALHGISLRRLTQSQLNQVYKGAFEHRSFIFFDEPNCWLSEHLMASYVALINDMVHAFKQQIVIVTHRGIDLFKEHARVYRVQKEGDRSHFKLIADPEQLKHQTLPQEYIKTLEIKGFKVFSEAKIELSPFCTVIVGNSNAGKSVLMEAFSAITHNDAGDEVIRHKSKKASVALSLVKGETEHLLLWERVAKTTNKFPRKVKYSLFDEQGQCLREAYQADGAPDFAQEQLKMRQVDGIDVHLSRQRDMDFLFAPDINDFTRAKILNLGKETAYISKMIDLSVKDNRERNGEIKTYEKQHNQLLQALEDSGLNAIRWDDDTLERCKEAQKRHDQHQQSEANLQKAVNRWGKLVQQQAIIAHSPSLTPYVHALKALSAHLAQCQAQTQQLKTHGVSWQKYLMAQAECVNLPNVQNWLKVFQRVYRHTLALQQSPLAHVLKQWQQLSERTFPHVQPILTALSRCLQEVNQHKNQMNSLAKLGKDWKAHQQKADSLHQQQQRLKTMQEAMANAKIQALQHLRVCPTCGTNLNQGTKHEHR